MTNTPPPAHDSTPCVACSRRSVLIGAAAAAVAVGCARGSAETTPVRVPIADIPVGGGRVYPPQRLVVTQPTAGTIRAFSAACPHQGCAISSVRDGVIECPCHGSRFSAVDGSVLRGPARQALSTRAVTIQEAEIIVR
jgi:Rieske Fe-S protein